MINSLVKSRAALASAHLFDFIIRGPLSPGHNVQVEKRNWCDKLLVLKKKGQVHAQVQLHNYIVHSAVNFLRHIMFNRRYEGIKWNMWGMLIAHMKA